MATAVERRQYELTNNARFTDSGGAGVPPVFRAANQNYRTVVQLDAEHCVAADDQ